MKALNAIIVLLVVAVEGALSYPSLYTKDDVILSYQGNVVELRGFNYFGFNNGQTMTDGLWSSDPLTGDFATVAWRQKLLGFNAVRLPFSFNDLRLPPRDFRYSNCEMPSPQRVAASVTPPGSSPMGNPPQLKYAPKSANSVCNEYLPMTSTRDRFLWVVQFYARNGFYVLIDNHLLEDQTALEDPDLWVQEWVSLLKDLMALPKVKDRLMVDLLNEPDIYGVGWDKLKDLYISAMDAIEKEVGDVLYFVEGTNQLPLLVNWGDGFSVERIKELGLGDPRPFFDELLTKTYKDRVVLSPHVYPPSVTFQKQNATGEGLRYRMSTSFGSKTKKGYCISDKKCKKFPIALGEFGSKFEEEVDLLTMNGISNYFSNIGQGNDGKHNPIPNWFYWSWNANSGDTGGIVQGNWKDVEWEKISFLEGMGLIPWYSGKIGTPEPVPMPMVRNDTVSSTQETGKKNKPDVENHAVIQDEQAKPEKDDKAKPDSPEQPRDDKQKKQEKSLNLETSPENAAEKQRMDILKQSCLVSYFEVDVPLTFGRKRAINIKIQNTGSANIATPWNLNISAAGVSEIGTTWNWIPVLLNDNTIKGEVSRRWLGLEAKGKGKSVGFTTSASDIPFEATWARLNDIDCELQRMDVRYPLLNIF